MPEREVEICRRLREFRLSRGQSQVFFAQRLGIDATMLASLEHARAPLRYYIAFNLFKYYPLNPQWLATGKGNRDSWFFIPPPDELSGCSIRAPYSYVYDQYLEEASLQVGCALHPILAKQYLGQSAGDALSNPDYRVEVEMKYTKEWVKDWFERVSDGDFDKFVDRLIKNGKRTFGRCKQDSDAIRTKRADQMNKARRAVGMWGMTT